MGGKKRSDFDNDKGKKKDLERQGLDAFMRLFESLDQQDSRLTERIVRGSDKGSLLSPIYSSKFRIWHKEHLKEFCLSNRVGFIKISHWKRALPHSAIRAIRDLELRSGSYLKGFYLLIPRTIAFQNKLPDRAILLSKMEDGRFAEIDSWGKKPNYWRRVWMWPLRNLTNSALFIFTISFLSAFVILPEEVILGPYDKHSFMLRVVFFFYLILAFAGLSVLYGFSKVKAFNEDFWSEDSLQDS